MFYLVRMEIVYLLINTDILTLKDNQPEDKLREFFLQNIQ